MPRKPRKKYWNVVDVVVQKRAQAAFDALAGIRRCKDCGCELEPFCNLRCDVCFCRWVASTLPNVQLEP